MTTDNEALAPWAWKAENRSLKSGYAGNLAFQGVGGGGELGNGGHALMRGPGFASNGTRPPS